MKAFSPDVLVVAEESVMVGLDLGTRHDGRRFQELMARYALDGHFSNHTHRPKSNLHVSVSDRRDGNRSSSSEYSNVLPEIYPTYFSRVEIEGKATAPTPATCRSHNRQRCTLTRTRPFERRSAAWLGLPYTSGRAQGCGRC